MLFGKLEIDYADGLLCDVTERAINDWWIEIGSEQYNAEPHDGILGPTTVAGLLGLLMGARNRLHAVGAPVSKDPFDVEAMKRGTSYFQKQQRMTRSRRLDRRTVEKLQKATQKAADHEGWTMPKVLKNTAAELSGKGGEMVMDAVGRRDRAGIAEVETCDIERFAQLVYGDRCKWLWLGKAPKKSRDHAPEKTIADEGRNLSRGLTFRQDDHGGFTWTARKSVADGMPTSKLPEDVTTPTAENGESPSDGESRAKTGVLKRASGFKNEAKSGLGKFKGAVGLRSHHQKLSADDSPTTPLDHSPRTRRPFFGRSMTSPETSPKSPRSPGFANTGSGLDDALDDPTKWAEADPEWIRDSANYDASLLPGGNMSKESLRPPPHAANEERNNAEAGQEAESDAVSESFSGTISVDGSVAGSYYNGTELGEVLPEGPEDEKSASHLLLRRTLSVSYLTSAEPDHLADAGYPRHLSFSLAEDSVLGWDSVLEDDTGTYNDDLPAQLANEEAQANQAKDLRAAITKLSTVTTDWTQTQLGHLSGLLEKADRDHATVDEMYDPHQSRVGELQMHEESVLRDQRGRLEEDGKEVETLAAKLEYEISGLKGRVEDVQASVGDFEKGVRRVEDRVAELEKEGVKGARWGCVVS